MSAERNQRKLTCTILPSQPGDDESMITLDCGCLPDPDDDSGQVEYEFVNGELVVVPPRIIDESEN